MAVWNQSDKCSLGIEKSMQQPW